MNRIAMTCLILVTTGGCMADPDLIEDNSYMSPRRPPAQAQSWSYSPQSATAAKKPTNDAASAAAATASKPPASRAADSQSDNKIVRTAYTLTKDAKDSDTHKSSRKEERPAEPEMPPVSLGMLRLTNSKRITFHYEIKDSASMGASGVEIWGTTDMRTWKKYDAKARPPSSLSVEIKDEGLYGFTVVARGKDETAKNQPPSDEPPQVWVAVDLTKPEVQLLGAEVNVQGRTTGGTPTPAPSLLVRWKAKDRNLGPRPITLLYAERPEGPWRPLAANLENNGRCEVSFPPDLPTTVYVRVQAVDLMGNAGMAQSTALHVPGQTSTRAARAPHPAVSILSVDGE